MDNTSFQPFRLHPRVLIFQSLSDYFSDILEYYVYHLCFYLLLLLLVCFFNLFLSVIIILFVSYEFLLFHMLSYFSLFSLFFHFPISCSVHTCSVPTRGHK